MVTRWTEADLTTIAAAVGEGADQGMRTLRARFGEDTVELALACQAADELAAGRTLEAGDGLTLSRDAPDGPTGSAVRALENSAGYDDRDFGPVANVIRSVR